MDILIGMNVVDEVLYGRYRAEMTPILASLGGSFGVDVRVSEVLRSPANRPFNRLFTIRFPSAAARDAFFKDPTYLEVRKRLFEPAVGYYDELAIYDVPLG